MPLAERTPSGDTAEETHLSLFITIEGIEGSGKSSLQARLSEALKSSFKEILLTREPGGTELGQTIRKLLLDSKSGTVSPGAELFLFAADRAQHVAEVVQPALARGAAVICDRFIHSTLAYQGYARGLDLTQLRNLNASATAGLRPDLVLLLDLDPELGLARARKRSSPASADPSLSWNRFEAEDLAFHRAVRDGFRALANDPAEKIFLIDASQSPDEVLKHAVQIVRDQRKIR